MQAQVVRDFAESRAQISAEKSDFVPAGYWTADGLLHSEALEMDRLRSQIRDRKIPVQGPFGIEPGGKCRKIECFEGEENKAQTS